MAYCGCELLSIIEAAGNKPKRIEEYVGFVNSQTSDLSIARMVNPEGWVEPGQKPDFSEYTIVLRGMLRVKTKSEEFDVHEGEAIITEANEWVQYSTPNNNGAEYIAVCLPAFSPDTGIHNHSSQLTIKFQRLSQRLKRHGLWGITDGQVCK